MKANLHGYRLAGVVGGLLLAAGQFWGPACLLQIVALLPLMVLVLRHRRWRPALLTGFYMGLAYTLPQMIYLRMPVAVTALLLVWLTLLLVLLCAAVAVCLPRHPVAGPLAVGAAWCVLDWVNYTAVPIWGLAQSFARSWTAVPPAIQFIAVTGISGVLFVIAAAQGLAAWWMVRPAARKPLLQAALALLLVVAAVNTVIGLEPPARTLRVAAAGWVFSDRQAEINPNTESGFETLFAAPAAAAAAEGARLLTTGEMGFYLAAHDRAEWIDRFAAVARKNRLWLVVGYYNLAMDANRLFFMDPDGRIVHEYTKTYKTPLEPGIPGSGDLKTVDIDGVTVGAMICHDDNYSRLMRRYGRMKADVVLCPTMDWETVNTAHLQAVRARAIECNLGIARGGACGTSAVISPTGRLLAKRNHYTQGPGWVMADIPVRQRQTLFARFGSAPVLGALVLLIVATMRLPHDRRCPGPDR